MFAAKTGGPLIVRADVAQGVPLSSGHFDHAVMLVVLEHLSDPTPVLREAFRILAPGGSLIMTWPNTAVDPIVHLLHRIGFVSDEMESEAHKQRIPLAQLLAVLREIGFERLTHRTFEFRLNNVLVAQKPSE